MRFVTGCFGFSIEVELVLCNCDVTPVRGYVMILLFSLSTFYALTCQAVHINGVFLQFFFSEFNLSFL